MKYTSEEATKCHKRYTAAMSEFSQAENDFNDMIEAIQDDILENWYEADPPRKEDDILNNIPLPREIVLIALSHLVSDEILCRITCSGVEADCTPRGNRVSYHYTDIWYSQHRFCVEDDKHN